MSKQKDEKRLEFKRFIADKTLRNTKQRMAVFDTFWRMKGHPNIEDIYAEVRKKHPSVGYATIYRTMKLLVESGIAGMRKFSDGTSRFEALGAGAHHDHLICLKCGGIIEFENRDIEALQDRVTREHEFMPSPHKLEIYGFCRKCCG
ncbi:MAG: transcriptional repressor [Deltaproteobacteria bacterium]|nr:transcriptional repressor [Deltaproteobacteria bacterium]